MMLIMVGIYSLTNNLMNIQKNGKSSQGKTLNESERDLNKLIDICNSYGLSEQETNQLLQQFRRGELFSPDRSLNETLNQSCHQLNVSHQHHQEQYSFKHPPQSIKLYPYQQSYDKDEEPINFEQQYIKQQNQNISNRNYHREQNNGLPEYFQHLLTQKFTVDKTIYTNLQLQNDKLLQMLQRTEQKIQRLIELRQKDCNIVFGLKDIISNLTLALKQKQGSYKQLQDKYNDVLESRVKQLSIKRSITQCMGTETQDISSNLSSQKQRDQVKTTAIKDNKQWRQRQIRDVTQQIKGKQNRKNVSKIDVKKYKQMIQTLRNNG